MKATNEIITDTEYQEILERLDFINNERQLLKSLSEQNNYNAHIELPNSFDELIIVLKREIQKNESYINFKKKEFLSRFSLSKSLKLKLEDKIEQLIFQCFNGQYLAKEKRLDSEVIPILMNYPGFEEFLEDILKVANKQANDLYLLEYFNGLQIEQTELIKKKYVYEKQQRKKLRKTRTVTRKKLK